MHKFLVKEVAFLNSEPDIFVFLIVVALFLAVSSLLFMQLFDVGYPREGICYEIACNAEQTVEVIKLRCPFLRHIVNTCEH